MLLCCCCCCFCFVVAVVVTLTLDGGDNLAGSHPQAPLASAETLEQGGGEAEYRGQQAKQAGDHQVQDKQVPGVPVDFYGNLRGKPDKAECFSFRSYLGTQAIKRHFVVKPESKIPKPKVQSPKVTTKRT